MRPLQQDEARVNNSRSQEEAFCHEINMLEQELLDYRKYFQTNNQDNTEV